jgi:hypothetical protein
MNNLKADLYLIYSEELLRLNIGYEFNKNALKKMKDIISNIIIENIYNIS